MLLKTKWDQSKSMWTVTNENGEAMGYFMTFEQSKDFERDLLRRQDTDHDDTYTSNEPTEFFGPTRFQEEVGKQKHKKSALAGQHRPNNTYRTDLAYFLPEWYQTMHAIKHLRLTRTQAAEQCGIRPNIFARFLNGGSTLVRQIVFVRQWLESLRASGEPIMSSETAQARAEEYKQKKRYSGVNILGISSRKVSARRLKRKHEGDTEEEEEDDNSASINDRIGPSYQAVIPPMNLTKASSESTHINEKLKSSVIWSATNAIAALGSEKAIDNYLAHIGAKSSIEIERGLAQLTVDKYKIHRGPHRCTEDNPVRQISPWTAEECTYFEHAIERLGRNFAAITESLNSAFTKAFQIKDIVGHYYNHYKLNPNYKVWKKGKKRLEEKQLAGEKITLVDFRPGDHIDRTHESECMKCGGSGELLMCDSCRHVAHLGCNDPPLAVVPEGQWFCMVCIAGKSIRDRVDHMKKNMIAALGPNMLDLSPMDLFVRDEGPEVRRRLGDTATPTEINEALKQFWDDLPRQKRLQYISSASKVRTEYKEGLERVTLETRKYERQMKALEKQRIASADTNRSVLYQPDDGSTSDNTESSSSEDAETEDSDDPDDSESEKVIDQATVNAWAKYKRYRAKQFAKEQIGLKYPIVPYGKFLKEQSLKGSYNQKQATMLWKALSPSKKASMGETFGTELNKYKAAMDEFQKSDKFKAFDSDLEANHKAKWLLDRQRKDDGKRIISTIHGSKNDRHHQKKNSKEGGSSNTKNVSYPSPTPVPNLRAFTFELGDAERARHIPYSTPTTVFKDPKVLDSREITHEWLKMKKNLTKKHFKLVGIEHPESAFSLMRAGEHTNPGMSEKDWVASGDTKMRTKYKNKFELLLKIYKEQKSVHERTKHYKDFVHNLDAREMEFRQRIATKIFSGESVGTVVMANDQPENSNKETRSTMARHWLMYRKNQIAKFEKENGLSRPPSSYVLFMQEQRKVYDQQENAHMTSKDISKIWNSMPNGEREHYYSKFEEKQKIFVEEKGRLEKSAKYSKFCDSLDSTGKKMWYSFNSKFYISPAGVVLPKIKGHRALPKETTVEAPSSTDDLVRRAFTFDGLSFDGVTTCNEPPIDSSSSTSSSSSSESSSEDEADEGDGIAHYRERLQAANNRSTEESVHDYVEKLWAKERTIKLRELLKSYDIKRPIAPFLKFYIESAKLGRELAKKNGTRKAPLDRKKMAVDFENYDPVKKKRLVDDYEREMAQYYKEINKLKKSKGYNDAIKKFDFEDKPKFVQQRKKAEMAKLGLQKSPPAAEDAFAPARKRIKLHAAQGKSPSEPNIVGGAASL